MVMTVPEEISRLKTRLAALEVGQNDIKAALNEIKDRLPTPKPEPRSPAPPAWAGSGENTGASYSGPPSVPQHAAAGISWVKEATGATAAACGATAAANSSSNRLRRPRSGHRATRNTSSPSNCSIASSRPHL